MGTGDLRGLFAIEREARRIGLEAPEAGLFKLHVSLGNDAFQPDWRDEVARILERTAERLRNGQREGRLMDENGNAVGSFCGTDPE
jgi:hypothetical protein